MRSDVFARGLAANGMDIHRDFLPWALQNEKLIDAADIKVDVQDLGTYERYQLYVRAREDAI